MATAGFWARDEAAAVERWVEDLRAIGYVEAPLYDWESELNAPSVLATGDNWYTRDNGRALPIFKFSPAQRPSIYLSDTVRSAHLDAGSVLSDDLAGCQLADVEAHVATIWGAHEMLGIMLDSWIASMRVA